MVNADVADEIYGRELARLFREVRLLAVCNRGYFKGASGVANERFYSAFSQLLDHLDHGLVRGVNAVLRVAARFDFDEKHPGNGYRSMITVIHKCCLRLWTISRYVTVNRESYLFRANHYSLEMEAYVTTLGQLRACLYYLEKLILYCDNGILFPDEEALSAEDYKIAERLMQEVEYLNQETFYGRCLGFQFCDSMVRPLTTINIAMACYSEGYIRSKNSLMRLANSVLSCRKYLMNPELRAKQVVNMTRTSDIHFCKSFWSLPENGIMHNVPLYMCPSVAVSKVITIDPIPFDLPLLDGSGSLTIHPPSAHSGVAPVMARLISSEYRQGQEFWFTRYGLRFPTMKTPAKPSPYLIIHCHGGGFVAQSSASHQMYLYFWANELGIPILSVDYTLAPESYFPRQQEELFFAYCWALKNAHLLGSTAEKICIVGDSAGANIAMSLAMQLSSCGLRCPEAVVSIYGALLVRYSPSPSRIMSLMDPLLPLGVVALCLRAYTGDDREDIRSRDSNSVVLNMDSSSEGELEPEACSSNGAASHLSIPMELNEAVEFNPVPILQGHRRTDSGFFDLGEQSEANSTASSRNSLKLSTVDSGCVFVQKDSSDDDSDSLSTGLSSSGDERSGQMFYVQENEISTSGTSNSLCRSLSMSLNNLRQSVSASALSDVCTGQSLLPPPESGSPLMSGYAKLCRFDQSPMESSRDVKNAKNPFVSPLMAPDDLLRKLCPVYLISCHLDPLLDDTITFGRRLKSLGKTVNLELIPDVPHGFLNFVLVSPEAKAASGRCVSAIRQMLSCETTL